MMTRVLPSGRQNEQGRDEKRVQSPECNADNGEHELSRLLQARTFAGDLSRGNRAAVITPGSALIVDDRCDVGIAQRGPKCRHRIRVADA